VPIIVSDTSPLRALHHLDLVHLLAQQFDEVLIPPAVAEELLRGSRTSRPIDTARLRGVTISGPVDATALLADEPELDLGEAEAITLALRVHSGQVLIDEAAGRVAAAKRGLRTVGVLGVLIEAKQSRQIASVRNLMDRLRDETRFFIADSLYLHVCEVVGE
jgi:predicted nucleic acid-binding protein